MYRLSNNVPGCFEDAFPKYELLQSIQSHLNEITIRKKLRSIYQKHQEVHQKLIARKQSEKK
jgi:hypothetical protein